VFQVAVRGDQTRGRVLSALFLLLLCIACFCRFSTLCFDQPHDEVAHEADVFHRLRRPLGLLFFLFAPGPRGDPAALTVRKATRFRTMLLANDLIKET
jgi:hypothetical protein